MNKYKGKFAVIILGIDPGLAIVGWGVIEYRDSRFTTIAYGAVTTQAHTPTIERLASVYDGIEEVIRHYHPEQMAIEELFFNNNSTTAIPVAEARGAILLCAQKNGVKVFEYTPLQVKQSVVGYGRAEKKQVIMMVRTILNLSSVPKLDDTADALAIAICHAHTGGSILSPYYNIK